MRVSLREGVKKTGIFSDTGGRRNAGGVDKETHRGGTEKRTWGDGQTHSGGGEGAEKCRGERRTTQWGNGETHMRGGGGETNRGDGETYTFSLQNNGQLGFLFKIT